MSDIKEVHGKPAKAACLCQPNIWGMAAMLRDSVAVVVVVVRTRPRAMPLTMTTMRKSTNGFPFLSYTSMGHRLVALRAAGAPLLHELLKFKHNSLSSSKETQDRVGF